MVTDVKIPVIEKILPIGHIIRYRGREYSISAPKYGNDYMGYPRQDTAMMYARNWRKAGTHISIVIKGIEGKNGKAAYFVYVTARKGISSELM